MTRTVNCLAEDGYVVRRRARVRRPPGRSSSSPTRAAPLLLADRRPPRRVAGPAPHRPRPPRSGRSCARPPRSSTDSPRRLIAHESHVPLPAQPHLPPLRHRRRRLQRRHLDAAGRPGLAGAPARRRQRRGASASPPACSSCPILLLSPLRRPGRRPDAQAPAAPADQPRHGRARGRARRPRVTGTAQIWHVYVLAFVLGIVAAFDDPARQSFVVRAGRAART